MSDRTLYIQRTDRGDRLAALSLIGPRTADTWRAGDTSTVDGALAAVRDGANWVRERLSASERHTLTTICLDPDGSICSWLSAPSTDPTILQAVARGVTTGAHDAEQDSDQHEAAVPTARALDHFGSVGSGMSLQSLTVIDPAANGHDHAQRRGKAAAADAASRRRLAVLGVPDSVGSLLIDTLDTLGVSAPPAISLWHAMARAWDPASPGNAREDAPHADRLVADIAPVTAVVLVEPHGRLTWAWSRAGTLLTGGSIRLPRARTAAHADPAGSDATRLTDSGPIPRLDPSQGARLAAEWLSWSAQTGAAPGRVILLTPENAAGLSPAEFAGALVKAWPGAMIDLITHDDPVTHTLQRALDDDGPTDPSASIIALTTRPSRAHRSMYVWSALAVGGLAAAAAVAAVMSWRTASDARARAENLRRQTREAAVAHFNDPTAIAPGVILALQDDLQRLEAQDAPADEGQFMPIMEELENISLAVSSLIASSPECELRSLTVDNITGVQLTVRFSGISTFEQFWEALPEVGASSLNWTRTSLGSQGAQANEATFRAGWPTARPGGAP